MTMGAAKTNATSALGSSSRHQSKGVRYAVLESITFEEA
jgi:hypothetical protein